MSDCKLSLTLEERTETRQRRVHIERVVIAGWTGRDEDEVRRHIEELQSLGVLRPPSVPAFYRVATARLTTANCIEVIGDTSSGEVEFLLLQFGGTLWLGVGSDHTDRRVESFDVGASKQMCDKPIAPHFWRVCDVASHWDQLFLRSCVGSGRTEYQTASVTVILEPTQLIAAFCGSKHLEEGTLMFCGTFPALGGIRSASPFAFELSDPVLQRTIRHSYEAKSLPTIG